MVLDFPLTVITAPLLSFALSFICILWLIKAKSNWILDHPNSRSLHVKPIPRSGGLGVLLGIIVTWLVYWVAVPTVLWAGMTLLIIVSLVDDVLGASVWSRLLVQSIAVAVFAIGFLYTYYEWWQILCIAVMIVWMSNLYNFMDGSDGLAGGMTVIGFGYYGCFALLEGNDHFALINFIVAAAALAFLLHNFHPARIFLGDVGSVPMGFLAATLGVMGWTDGLWTIWFPFLVFSPFIADATVTLIKRTLHGEKFWKAHREHYYQRLVQSGWGHRNTALFGYALMLGAGGSAVWAGQQDLNTQLWTAMIWVGIYSMLMIIADRNQKIFYDHG